MNWQEMGERLDAVGSVVTRLSNQVDAISRSPIGSAGPNQIAALQGEVRTLNATLEANAREGNRVLGRMSLGIDNHGDLVKRTNDRIAELAQGDVALDKAVDGLVTKVEEQSACLARNLAKLLDTAYDTNAAVKRIEQGQRLEELRAKERFAALLEILQTLPDAVADAVHGRLTDELDALHEDLDALPAQIADEVSEAIGDVDTVRDEDGFEKALMLSAVQNGQDAVEQVLRYRNLRQDKQPDYGPRVTVEKAEPGAGRGFGGGVSVNG